MDVRRDLFITWRPWSLGRPPSAFLQIGRGAGMRAQGTRCNNLCPEWGVLYPTGPGPLGLVVGDPLALLARLQAFKPVSSLCNSSLDFACWKSPVEFQMLAALLTSCFTLGTILLGLTNSCCFSPFTLCWGTWMSAIRDVIHACFKLIKSCKSERCCVNGRDSFQLPGGECPTPSAIDQSRRHLPYGHVPLPKKLVECSLHSQVFLGQALFGKFAVQQKKKCNVCCRCYLGSQTVPSSSTAGLKSINLTIWKVFIHFTCIWISFPLDSGSSSPNPSLTQSCFNFVARTSLCCFLTFALTSVFWCNIRVTASITVKEWLSKCLIYFTQLFIKLAKLLLTVVW